jgi:hypothetical protein
VKYVLKTSSFPKTKNVAINSRRKIRGKYVLNSVVVNLVSKIELNKKFMDPLIIPESP